MSERPAWIWHDGQKVACHQCNMMRGKEHKGRERERERERKRGEGEGEGGRERERERERE